MSQHRHVNILPRQFHTTAKPILNLQLCLDTLLSSLSPTKKKKKKDCQVPSTEVGRKSQAAGALAHNNNNPTPPAAVTNLQYFHEHHLVAGGLGAHESRVGDGVCDTLHHCRRRLQARVCPREESFSGVNIAPTARPFCADNTIRHKRPPATDSIRHKTLRHRTQSVTNLPSPYHLTQSVTNTTRHLPQSVTNRIRHKHHSPWMQSVTNAMRHLLQSVTNITIT